MGRNATARNEYLPDHVSPPGETLEEILGEVGMTQAELARRTGRPAKTINEIIQGKAAITAETALQLERVLGVPAGFWIQREQNYRESLARHDEKNKLAEHIDWLDEVPVRAMMNLGWIESRTDKIDQLREVLDFFGIASPEQWDNVYQHARLRQSAALQTNSVAVAAWLRKGELTAQNIDCATYQEFDFKTTLAEIRKLTGQPVDIFQGNLIELCSYTGVAVTFVHELPKTGLSGATYWLTPDKAVIQLSLRYRTNDQLWFTFFHEAGHILLHGKRDTFLEGEWLDTAKEREANDFATNFLISPEMWQKIVRTVQKTPAGLYPSTHIIEELAEQAGIAAGILAGRLQHEGIVPLTHYNGLKVRLTWAEN